MNDYIAYQDLLLDMGLLWIQVDKLGFWRTLLKLPDKNLLFRLNQVEKNYRKLSALVYHGKIDETSRDIYTKLLTKASFDIEEIVKKFPRLRLMQKAKQPCN